VTVCVKRTVWYFLPQFHAKLKTCWIAKAIRTKTQHNLSKKLLLTKVVGATFPRHGTCLQVTYKRKIVVVYVQSSAVISRDVSAHMQHVVCSLVVNVEDPVFSRQPVISNRLLPFQTQSVAARRRQKVKPLQTKPEVLPPAATVFPDRARSPPSRWNRIRSCSHSIEGPSRTRSLPRVA